MLKVIVLTAFLSLFTGFSVAHAAFSVRCDDQTKALIARGDTTVQIQIATKYNTLKDLGQQIAQWSASLVSEYRTASQDSSERTGKMNMLADVANHYASEARSLAECLILIEARRNVK